MTTDIAYSGLGIEFAQQAMAKLPEGGCAVLATVWEDWAVPIDQAMAPYGGVVARETTEELEFAHIRCSPSGSATRFASCSADPLPTGGAAVRRSDRAAPRPACARSRK